MWTFFIGFALGVFQAVVLRKSVEMMTASKSNIPMGVLITVGKLALILVVLWLVAKYVSIQSVLWCAGGLAIAMIIIPVIRNHLYMKKLNAQANANQEEK